MGDGRKRRENHGNSHEIPKKIIENLMKKRQKLSKTLEKLRFQGLGPASRRSSS